MFPKSLLPHISANACKTYLALLTHVDPRSPNPVAKVPMKALVQLTGFSTRTCANALRELCTLGLLRRQPHGYHQSRSYFLLSPPALTALQALSTRPKFPLSPSGARLPAPKTPNRQPVAALLNHVSNRQPVAGMTLQDAILVTQRIEALKREIALRQSPSQNPPQPMP